MRMAADSLSVLSLVRHLKGAPVVAGNPNSASSAIGRSGSARIGPVSGCPAF